MAEDWTESEIDAVVADYFGMLGDELAGRPFVKLARYRSLAELGSKLNQPIENLLAH